MNWGHRWVNIDAPKGLPEVQNVTDWVLFMEQSCLLSIITALFLFFKPTYKKLVHHTLFLNGEVTSSSPV